MIRPSTHPARVLAALLFAPLVGCICGLLVFTVLNGEPIPASEIPQVLGIGGWVWIYSLPLSLPLGALIHFILVKLRLWPVTAYTLVGLLLGPLALLVWLWALGGSFLEIDAQMAWLGAITGGLTALTFRLLVHRMDDSPSSPPAGTRPY